MRTSPCSSIGEAIETSYYGESEFICVVLLGGTHSNDESGINVGGSILPVTSNGNVAFEVPNAFSSSSSVFLLSSGILNTTGFTVELKKNLGSGCSIVCITSGGSVILNSMILTGGSSDLYPPL